MHDMDEVKETVLIKQEHTVAQILTQYLDFQQSPAVVFVENLFRGWPGQVNVRVNYLDYQWQKCIIGPITVKSFADEKHIVIVFNNKNAIHLTADDIVNNNQFIEPALAPVISGKYQMLTTEPYIQMSYIGKKG